MKQFENNRICKNCQQQFKVKSIWQSTKKYCSDACKREWQRSIKKIAITLCLSIILLGNFNEEQSLIASKYDKIYKSDYYINMVDNINKCGSVKLKSGNAFWGCTMPVKNKFKISVWNGLSDYNFERVINHEIFHVLAPRDKNENHADSFSLYMYNQVN